MTPQERQFQSLFGPYFTLDEFRCKCRTADNRVACEAPENWWLTPEFKAFMAKLVRMRNELGFPFVINSGYRCPAYNDSLYDSDGTHRDGPHTIAAADIKVNFERMYDLVNLATEYEMGVGIDQKGDVAKRFVHVDNLGRRLWTY